MVSSARGGRQPRAAGVSAQKPNHASRQCLGSRFERQHPALNTSFNHVAKCHELGSVTTVRKRPSSTLCAGSREIAAVSAKFQFGMRLAINDTTLRRVCARRTENDDV